MNRASQFIAYLLAIASFVAVANTSSRAVAQPGGGMGNFPTSSQSMFGKKKDMRDVSGPSLSATDEPVAEIRIVGNTTIPTSHILNQLQSRVGRPFDPALVQKDQRRLLSKGWFVDVQPSYEQSPKGRVLIFKVIERPIVRYVEYLGNSEIRTKKISKETDLKVGGPVDPYAVQEAKRKITELYHRNGFNNVQVSILEGDKPTDHGIVFVIHEGQAQKIWKVEFIGNEFVSESRLRTKIDSKPPTLMIFKGYVDRDQIDSDVKKLTEYYRSFGYFDAKIGRELIFDDKNKWVTLRFVVHEGKRYQVESVAFIGNRLFSSKSLTSGVEMKPDPTDRTAVDRVYHFFRPLAPGPQPFEQARMNADVAWLKELYGSQGYIFADVEAEPIYLEEPGKLKLMYHIEEGKRWRVGNIYVHINGDNPHTKIQTALNRLSFQSGQIADVRELRASERRLQASGLFLTDPVRGVSPKITYTLPGSNDSEMASRKKGSGFRGQSPDETPQRVNDAWATTPSAAVDGPALIAPPSAEPSLQAPPVPTYKVAPPANFVPGDDAADIHIYLESQPEIASVNVTASSDQQISAPGGRSASGASTPQAYEVRRPPYDEPADAVAQSNQGWSSGTSYPQSQYAYQQPTQQVTQQQNAPSNQNTYQRFTVRTQSPYQAATTPSYAPPATATQAVYNTSGQYTAQPAAVTPYNQYGSTAYGGQTVGATGPDTVAAGTTKYPVQQTAITEPQLPPTQPTTVTAPVATPPFAAPPVPTAETLPPPSYPAPQYAPAPQPVPQYAPAPAYGAPPAGPPPQMLPPNPNITPIAPPPGTGPATGPVDPFTPTQMFNDPAVDMDVVLSEAQTGRLMLGVAVNSDAGLVGQILLDEQNFDWTRPPTSWDDFVSGRAWRGAGQRFRLEAAPGTQVQRYLASFTEPNLMDSQVSLGLSGSYFTRKYRDWDEERAGGRVSLGYQWVENDLSTAVAYRGENVVISNPANPAPPELTETVGSNTIHGFKWTVANDTRDSAFLATEGHFLQLELEEVVGSFQYPRAIVDARQYFLLAERPDHSGRHVLTASTRVGFTGNDTPVFENFFAGGFSTLRGFEFRGASPVDAATHVQVGGQFEWLNTLEYLFPLSADDMIHGVAFVDFGTVEQNVAIHSQDFRVAPGLGLRITVPAMGPAPIALDFAFPVAKADTDNTQVFSFNIGLQR